MQGTRQSQRGFTLVEAMVRILVVAVLLAMAVTALQKIRQIRHDRAVVGGPP
jgi:prepilin-type N-terminal cleavage/methylation domain-containing protein